MTSPTMAALRRALPFMLGAAGLAAIAVAIPIFIGSPGFGYDYTAYDAAARRLASGAPLYPPGTAESYNAGSYAGLYLYAPPLAVALLPAAAVPAETATMIWFIARIGVLAIGCGLLPVRAEVRAATFGVAALSFPVLIDLNLGNLSIVLFALSAVMWRWLDRPLGSIALALILSVRYAFVTVLIWWLARGRLRPVAWTIGAGLVIAALTLPIVGIAGYVDYVTILRGLDDISTGPHNLALGTTVNALGGGPALITLANLAGWLMAFAAIAYAARRRDREVGLAVALSASLLFAPFFHDHYLVELLIPAALLAQRGRWWGLALPLLGWLPDTLLPAVALAGIVAPFLAGEPGGSSPARSHVPAAASAGPG
jgi:hypothetical protein